MANGFFTPRVDLAGRVQRGSTDLDFGPIPSTSIESTEKVGFKEVMNGLSNGLNQSLNAPDKLLQGAMSGDSNVDIHDVMTAMAKADLTINIATQMTSKVIQAYDKIMQISV